MIYNCFMDKREFEIEMVTAICEELAKNSGIKNPEKYVSFVDNDGSYDIFVSPAIYKTQRNSNGKPINPDRNIDECLSRAAESISVDYGFDSEVLKDEH